MMYFIAAVNTEGRYVFLTLWIQEKYEYTIDQQEL